LPKHQVGVWKVAVVDAARHYAAWVVACHCSDLNLERDRAAAQDDTAQELE